MVRVLPFFVVFFASAAAAAQTWPALDEPPTIVRAGAADVAVIVAAEDYVFVPDVTGARQNLREWEVFLREAVGARTITTLVDEQATREEILAAAESATKLATGESTVWFVFIGHGAPSADGGDGVLLGVDTQQTARSVAARGVARQDVLRVLDQGPQKRTVVLLDACFSGRLPSGEAIVPDAQPVVPVGSPLATDRTAILSAAASNELAGPLPGLGRPAFSYLVLGGLRGWADDGDGQVTANEAVRFAHAKLLTVEGRRQTPSLAGDGDMVLAIDARERLPEAPMAEVVQRPMQGSASSSASSDPPGEVVVSDSAATAEPAVVAVGAGLGVGGELAYETATPMFDAYIALPARRFRALVGIGYLAVTNVAAVRTEQILDDALRPMNLGATIDVATRTHLMTLTAGPAVNIDLGRRARLFADLRAGLSLPLAGECQEWDYDETLAATGCRDRETAAHAVYRGRLGVGYRALELAAHGNLLSRKFTHPDPETGADVDYRKSLFVAGLTLGVGFDL